MTDFEKETIMNLALGKITKDDFLKTLDISESMLEEYTLTSLQNGYKEKDRDAIEYTFYFGYDVSYSERFIDILNKLMIEDWHICHEDIARLLQKLKSPDSIDYLYKAIFVADKLWYLPFDMSGALIRKCCFALGDIDTERSRQILKVLTSSENDLIKEAALEQTGINQIR
jgi:hypothetical protein